ARLAAGLLLGCLPCGLLYAALLRSAAAASPLQSSLSMAAFGLGTAGPLLGLGLFSATINRRFGVGGPRLAAACVSVMGALLIWRGVMPVVGRVHPFH
ncbi:MAG TPA: sulfite exporter TauE/SafE family protein, partial [Bryobacteraceae bacterium]|nr:sulfite exporter TauE/SafE family protein [Bryobacteraceae bacterium]